MRRVQGYIVRSGGAPPTNHRERGVYVGLKMPTAQEAYETLRAMGHRSRYRPEYATAAADERRAWAVCEEIAALLPRPCAPGMRGSGAPRAHLGPRPYGTWSPNGLPVPAIACAAPP